MGNLELNSAVGFLNQGKLIAYPTEAVWGIGCDPFNESAVLRLLAIKQRPVEKGLILVAADLSQIAELVSGLPSALKEQLNSSWPGPTTWLIPDERNLYPAWIKGEHASIAIRVSAHPLVKSLCEGFGKPIVSTSANTSGQPEIRTQSIVEKQFTGSIDYILPGKLGEQSSPSQIRDLISGEILR
jgi:L-threonylcarbamoyladenylate synthase